MVRLGLATLALVVGLIATTTAARATSRTEATPVAVRDCAARWNWIPIRYVVPFGSGRAAVVRAYPCRVDVYYNGSPRAGGWNWLGCGVDQFGAYACDTHAHGVARSKGSFSKPNARYEPATGMIRLVGDATPAKAPKPAWVTRWRWDNGFIVPFDRDGHLLPGITVKHRYRRTLVCGRPELRRSLVAYCGAGGVAIYPRWPLHRGDPVAFTATVLAGSTSFDIFRAP
jgi:hypothetical protein